MLIDSHCHFDFFTRAQQDELWARAQAAGVETLLIPAVSRKTWPQAAEAAARFPLYAAYGLHPIFPHQRADLAALDAWLDTHPAAAVGECGLDYTVAIDRREQQYCFEGQIAIAASRKLPLILHARKSLDAVLCTLRRYPDVRFVIHSFTGSDQQLAQIFHLGGYIGIGGTSTYPRAQRLRRQLAAVPSDRYVLETDAPDQPLCGYQGRYNEPALTAKVAENLAQLRGEPYAKICADSTASCHTLLHL